MSELHNIPCPYCDGVLFRSTLIAPDVRGVVREPGTARFGQDGAGAFYRCQHCGERVDMIVTSVPGCGAKMTIAPGQGRRR
jgi:DNA-directed RNA polymerase subunit RPC12/RpoP